MRQHYLIRSLLWLAFISLSGTLPTVRAQSVPPQIQWQRLIEGADAGPVTSVRAAKVTGGGYGVLAGKTLSLLSATGSLIWTEPVPGSYADSTINRIPVQETRSVVASPDGGLVTLAVDVSNRYYVTKVDSAGQGVWAKTISRADNGTAVQQTENALAVGPDGSYLVVGSFIDQLAYLSLTKLSAEGYITGRWRVRLSDFTSLNRPLIRQVLPLSDQGYLLVGQSTGSSATDSQGFAVQLNAQYAVVWQKRYPALTAIQDVVASAASGTFTAVGSGTGGSGRAITIAPNKADDGKLLASLAGMVSVVSLVNDGAGRVTVLDAASTTNGDFRLSNGQLPTTFFWTKTLGGSGTDVPTALLPTDDGGYLAVGTTRSTDGDVRGKSTTALATWVLKLGTTPQATTLRILPPTYNCQTGAISFQTRGGDGSPITYQTPGITRARPADTFGTVEQAFRTDTSVIILRATQSGQTVSYRFDLAAYCRSGQSNSSSSDTLSMSPPTYNCQTGALMFRVVGSSSAPIEYAVEGIIDWTTNPTVIIDPRSQTATNAPLIKLMARQNGKVVTYRFDVKAACGLARIGVEGMMVKLLGNPVQETAVIEITGAEGQAIMLNLYDNRGGLIEQRTIEQAQTLERQAFDVQQQPTGTLLLQTSMNGQTRTVRILKR